MTTPQFTAMPVDTQQGLEKCRHPNALHVLLWHPNLPMHYVVYDGDKYWFFNPNLGWESRREFKGTVDYLRFVPSYTAMTLNLPFKIRNIDEIYWDCKRYEYWYQYNGLHQHKQ